MIGQVENLLRDLQGAVSARMLYAADHPRVTEVLARVHAHAASVLEARDDLSVFWLDGRLVFDGVPLPGGDTVARALFATLRERGSHRLTIRRGVTPAELGAFVTAMAEASRGTAELRGSMNIRFSAFDETGKGHQGAPVAHDTEHRNRIRHLWAGVTEHRQLDADGLEFTMLAMAQTVDRNVSSFLPLASMKAHDDYTVTHIVNVALLSMALAEAVDLKSGLVRDIGVAALLHDIGKLGVPVEVLNATGRLTEQQRNMIRRHPVDGARMLLTTPGAPQLAVAVAFEHHMHFSGGGYPTVPRGYKMNLASEITHVADVFDALRTNRPYRAALSRDRIRDMMERDAGTVFEPRLVKVFFDAVIPRTADAFVEPDNTQAA